VGVVAFCAEYGSFYGLYVEAKWPLYIANSISFGLGLLTSFLLNRLWTFSHKKYQKKPAHQFSFYMILALINLVLTNLLVGWLKFMGVNPRIGKLAAMIITSLWNYILFKLIIFTHQPPEANS
jgi:putative flippase GtrA